MSYANFTNLEIKQHFGVEQQFRRGLFDHVAPRPASDLLRQTLAANVSFALMQGTEKARSEFIIAPVMAELRQQAGERVSIFSGVKFDVDRKRKLYGWCDFLISRSPYQAVLEAPVVVAVEAKRQDFRNALPQCVAEMYAAKLFNESRNADIQIIYGVITIGTVWQFLKLENQNVESSGEEYTIENVDKIFLAEHHHRSHCPYRKQRFLIISPNFSRQTVLLDTTNQHSIC